MTAAEESVAPPRAVRRRRAPRQGGPAATDLAVRPPGPDLHAVPDERDDDAPAWFTYTAADDEVAWSDALGQLLGHTVARGAISHHPIPAGAPSRQVLLSNVHRDDHARALHAVTRAWTTRLPVHTALRLVRTDGSWFDVDCRLEAVTGADGSTRGVRGSVRDVTARERARREVSRLTRRGETVQPATVQRDAGTGLLARAAFADELDRARRRGGAVLVLRVEPEYRAGARGDDGQLAERHADLLHRAARLLEGVVGPTDLLGRVGPNEIGVLLAGTWVMARRQADLFVEVLCAHPFVLPDAWLRARSWAGLVRFPAGAEASSHDLLIDAEHAWRQSREADRPITLVAQPVPVRQRQESYRRRVAEALGTDRFTLYSQPILELQTNRVTRHELLLRVLDDTGGPQSPIHVLDVAERLDAVYDIDRWVLERALQLAGERRDLSLQVNVSGRSVGDPRLCAEVERLIERYAVNPERITFEITETALIGNLSEARRFADRVRDLGCQLALDDFGSGYASFRYLRLFPIDLVKIDGEYVVDLAHNPQDQVLVRALVEVCQAYGIHTVAEYVQDEATLRLLREFGVDYVQGYLIGRPEPCDVLLAARDAAPPSPRTRLRRPPNAAVPPKPRRARARPAD